jgi:hypothetical protein
MIIGLIKFLLIYFLISRIIPFFYRLYQAQKIIRKQLKEQMKHGQSFSQQDFSQNQGQEQQQQRNPQQSQSGDVFEAEYRVLPKDQRDS